MHSLCISAYLTQSEVTLILTIVTVYLYGYFGSLNYMLLTAFCYIFACTFREFLTGKGNRNSSKHGNSKKYRKNMNGNWYRTLKLPEMETRTEIMNNAHSTTGEHSQSQAKRSKSISDIEMKLSNQAYINTPCIWVAFEHSIWLHVCTMLHRVCAVELLSMHIFPKFQKCHISELMCYGNWTLDNVYMASLKA